MLLNRREEGEFAFSQDDFRDIAQIAQHRAGISLKDSKRTMVYARLSKRLRELGLSSFAEYLDFVRAPEGEGEISVLISALTTNVTAFFRESHHFEYLADAVLPNLIQTARSGGRVRMWSSACSSGEEPYSMALTLLKSCPDAARYDIRILATDVNEKVVQQGLDGVYPAESVANIPKDLQHYIEKCDGRAGMVQMSDAVKRLVAFRQLNLFEAWPFKGSFDVIFCRNVAIYFDKPTQDVLWQSLCGRLNAGGHLFIGHSERIAGPAADMLVADGVTHYCKLGGAGQVTPSSQKGRSAICH